MGEMVSFAANGGTCSGYLAKPASGTGKGVVVFQEWWGLNGNIKGIADRLAAEGFVALAPDMYHGEVTAEPDEAGKLLMALNIEQAAKDASGAVAYLKGATGEPVGTTGFLHGRRAQPVHGLQRRRQRRSLHRLLRRTSRGEVQLGWAEGACACLLG